LFVVQGIQRFLTQISPRHCSLYRHCSFSQ
jgi:hypothetical protein